METLTYEDKKAAKILREEAGFSEQKAGAMLRALGVVTGASRSGLKDLEIRIIKWMIGIQVAQFAATISLFEIFVV